MVNEGMTCIVVEKLGLRYPISSISRRSPNRLYFVLSHRGDPTNMRIIDNSCPPLLSRHFWVPEGPIISSMTRLLRAKMDTRISTSNGIPFTVREYVHVLTPQGNEMVYASLPVKKQKD